MNEQRTSTIPTTSLNRRAFLRATAQACAAATVLPVIVPSSALGAKGSFSPSNKINVGILGSGQRGVDVLEGFMNHADCLIRVVCDVNKPSAEKALAKIAEKTGNRDVIVLNDFREAVARADVDAFIVAAPDHWHALLAIEAMKAGKDVYVEKPLALTVEEGQVVRSVARRKKRVFQFGTQQRSGRMFRLASELALNGRLGKLQSIKVWAPGSSPGGSRTVVPPPEGLDYDLWLGPARKRQYTEDLVSDKAIKRTWWFVSDFSLGFLTGWGIHPMDVALWGAGDLMDGTVTVQGRGNYRPAEGVSDTATIWDVDYKFSSGLEVKFVGTPNGSNKGDSTGEPFLYKDEWTKKYRRIETHGTAFEGTNGWAHVDRTGINLNPEDLIDLNPDELKRKLPLSSDHARNFLDCIKNRTDPVSTVEDAVKGDILCQMADISMRLGRKLTFDMKSEKFVRDDSANARLRAHIRKPWKLA